MDCQIMAWPQMKTVSQAITTCMVSVTESEDIMRQTQLIQTTIPIQYRYHYYGTWSGGHDPSLVVIGRKDVQIKIIFNF